MDVFVPETKDDISQFYLIVVFVFIAINIIWDIVSSKTPPFVLKSLKTKVSVVFSAATFGSSLLFLLSLADRNLLPLLGDMTVPIVVSGVGGVLVSVADLSPH